MAVRSFKSSSWTPVAVADTTAFTNQGYMALQGGSGTQRIIIGEVYIGGAAGAAAPTLFAFSRDSVVGATLTALTTGESDAAFDPATAALAAPASPFTQSTTKPQRSATLGLWAPTINAFGGIARLVPAPGWEISLLGNTASFGEVSLSAYTGGTPGLVSAHIEYQPL